MDLLRSIRMKQVNLVPSSEQVRGAGQIEAAVELEEDDKETTLFQILKN